MQPAPEVAQQRATLVGERGREAGRRVERLDDLEELRGIEASAAGRPADPGLDVVRGADPDAGTLLEQRAGLVGLVEGARDDHGVGRRLERLGDAA